MPDQYREFKEYHLWQQGFRGVDGLSHSSELALGVYLIWSGRHTKRAGIRGMSKGHDKSKSPRS